MTKLTIAIMATMLTATPSLAQDEDWWLVSGEAGDASVHFIDAASIEKKGNKTSFDVATFWRNGRDMERRLTMNCDEKPAEQLYADMWTFACGSNSVRMSSALKVGGEKPGSIARAVFAIPS